MDINKLDKIVLKQSDIVKIGKWYEFHFDEMREKGVTNFPLEECLFEMMMNDLPSFLPKSYVKQIVHFKLDKDNLNMFFDLFIGDEDNPTISWVLDEGFLQEGKINWKSHLKSGIRIPDETAQETARFCTKVVFETFAYMTNVTENVVEKKMSKSITKKAKKKNKNNKNRSVKISVTRYEFDFERGESQREYERHTLAWTVRGHWRYIKKTGKRVWVKGYIKGDTEKVEGKTYKF
jgi:hypothetical protein